MRIAVLLILLSRPFSSLFAAEDPVQMSQKLRMEGDYAQAEKILRAALENGDAASATRAVLLNTLGDLLREQDRCAEARPLFEQVLKMENLAWRPRFSALVGLAEIHRQSHEWTGSMAEWTEARGMAESHDNSLLATVAIRGEGETWLDRGDTARAEPLLKKAVYLLENDSQAPRFRLAVALGSLATLYRLENKLAMAEELWGRELKIDRELMGNYHPQTALVMGHLAEAWAADGDYERARDYSHQVLDIMESHFQHISTAVASALINDGLIEQHARNYAAAADRYSQALGIVRSSSSVSGSEAAMVSRLYQSALSQAPHSHGTKQINGFTKDK